MLENVAQCIQDPNFDSGDPSSPEEINKSVSSSDFPNQLHESWSEWVKVEPVDKNHPNEAP